MIGAYFSAIPLLQSIVSPNLELPNPNAAREFGLLENMQHVILAAVCVRAAMAVRQQRDTQSRVVFALVTVITAFILLEELDYGLHYFDLATDYKNYDNGEMRNLHNLGETADFMKRAGDVMAVLLFGLAPLVFHRSRNVLIRRYLPSLHAVLALIAMFLLRSHFIRCFG
jgi:hypothetical protein